MVTLEQREGQVLLREDPAITPQECTVNLLAFPNGYVATYQGVLIKVTGLSRSFKDYRTLALV